LAKKETQPHLVTDVELEVAMVGIIVSLGILLQLEEAITDLDDEVVAIPKHVIHHGGG
jgi:hypothetical protein